MNKKLMAIRVGLASLSTTMMMAAANVSAFASEAETTTAAASFDDIANPVVDLISKLLTPALAVVGALGTLYCVLLGVKYARAEEPQEHEKAKKALRNAIVGFVLIFVLILALRVAMPIMKNWAGI